MIVMLATAVSWQDTYHFFHARSNGIAPLAKKPSHVTPKQLGCSEFMPMSKRLQRFNFLW